MLSLVGCYIALFYSSRNIQLAGQVRYVLSISLGLGTSQLVVEVGYM